MQQSEVRSLLGMLRKITNQVIKNFPEHKGKIRITRVDAKGKPSKTAKTLGLLYDSVPRKQWNIEELTLEQLKDSIVEEINKITGENLKVIVEPIKEEGIYTCADAKIMFGLEREDSLVELFTAALNNGFSCFYLKKDGKVKLVSLR
ncbi:MAG: hypothetical protein F6J98_01655 [Moorea sp. SIO4G2]|nr:hypothetical protein [Moorena sp. SIO4G2]